jgi:superfamily II DNA helicase RecQ
MADVTPGLSSETSSDENTLYRRAMDHALASLGYGNFKPAQETTLRYFLAGKDVFVSLPTGYGKSIIYQAAPICKDFLLGGNSLLLLLSLH